jgi:hypothetical protein
MKKLLIVRYACVPIVLLTLGVLGAADADQVGSNEGQTNKATRNNLKENSVAPADQATTNLLRTVECFIEAADRSDSYTVASLYAPDFVNVRVTDSGDVIRLDRKQMLSIFARAGGHHIPTKSTTIHHVEVVGENGFVLLTRIKDLGNGWETKFYSLVWQRSGEQWRLSREFVHQRSLPVAAKTEKGN